MTNADLDEATTDHPVFVSTRYGHVAMSNSYAMRLGEVHSEMPDPAGGRVYRYPGTADPNGVLGEMPAQDLVTRHIPAYTQDELRGAFIQAVEDNLKVGVTSVQDAAVSNRRGSKRLRAVQPHVRRGPPQAARQHVHPLQPAQGNGLFDKDGATVTNGCVLRGAR